MAFIPEVYFDVISADIAELALFLIQCPIGLSAHFILGHRLINTVALFKKVIDFQPLFPV